MGRLLTATVAVHSRKPASIGGVSGPSGTHLDNGGGIVADAPNVWPLPHRGTAYPVTTEPPPPPSETAQAHIFRSRSRLGSPLGGRGPSPVATPHSERLLCAVWGGPRRPHLLITPPRSVGHTLPLGAHPCDCPYPIVASVPPFHQSYPPLPTIVPLPHTTRRTVSFPPPSTPPPSRRILCTCV